MRFMMGWVLSCTIIEFCGAAFSARATRQGGQDVFALTTWFMPNNVFMHRDQTVWFVHRNRRRIVVARCGHGRNSPADLNCDTRQSAAPVAALRNCSLRLFAAVSMALISSMALFLPLAVLSGSWQLSNGRSRRLLLSGKLSGLLCRQQILALSYPHRHIQRARHLPAAAHSPPRLGSIHGRS